MESGCRKLRANPRASASWFSTLFFAWTIPIFKRTYDTVLSSGDISEPLKTYKSNLLGERLERNWLDECKNKTKPSLIKAVVKTFWFDYLLLGLICVFTDIISPLVLPFLLRELLSYFREDTEMSQSVAFKYGSAICFMAIVPGIGLLHQYFLVFVYGMRVRVAVCSLIYRKALRLSQTSLSDTAPGKLVNLLSNDVNRFEYASFFVNSMWTSPIVTIIATYILWIETRWAGMFGLLMVFLIVPVQTLRTDERVRFMDEIISGVQVIKMYVWEKPFARLITESRRFELKTILNNGYVRALHMTFNLFVNRLALFCTVLSIIFTYGRESIDVSKIFMVSCLFHTVSFAMCRTFVRGIAEIGEAFVSFKCLQAFLDYEEKEQPTKKNNGFISDKKPSADDIVISLKNVSAGWSETTDQKQTKRSKKALSYKSNTNGTKVVNEVSEHQAFKLEDVNLEVLRGKLVFVIGPVGAGKSTFMQVLLKELPLACGSMGINGTISYASQESWIFTSTVRQNITFGQPMDRARYDEVVQCSALRTDFAQLSEGDMTVVGENGTGLSGGQKARINLARAVYRQADIYLIDDPLSAVDTHVQSHLFNNCLGPKGYLARQNATRILITHQVHFLKEADWVIVLKNGKIEAQGVYSDILKSGIDIADMLNKSEENDEEESKETDGNAKIKSENSSTSLKKMIHSTTSLHSEKSKEKKKRCRRRKRIA